VEVENIRRAIRLVEWFRGEATRVYKLQGEGVDARQQRRLVEFVQRKGGVVTVRDVQRGALGYATSAEAEEALNGLAQAGLGAWDIESTPTNKRRIFRLFPPMTMTDSRISRDSGECVSVSEGDAPQFDPNDQLNELANEEYEEGEVLEI
jgi:hypothetical protein